MTKRVLVTGAKGFTGRYLVEELENSGYEVFGLEDSKGEVDLLDSPRVLSLVKMVKPDSVIHLAGISSPVHDDPMEIHKVNSVGTVHLLSALAKQAGPPQKVILASSAHVYARSELAIAETHKVSPQSHYAISKAVMEMLATEYVDRFPVLLTRPFNYTGSGQPENFVVPKLVANFKERQENLRLGNTDVYRDFSHVTDIVKAYRSLLESDIENGAINLCSGQAVSIGEIITCLSQITGHQINVVRDESLVRPDENKCIVGDPGKLFSVIDYRPTYDLESILRAMLNDD
jgi:nucleoside-diphosphate-sugar epimerase